jgi:hypothetical protein
VEEGRPKITHVAVRFQGRTWSLPRPYRHHHVLRVIWWLAEEFGEWTKEKVDSIDAHGEDQGFLDEEGRYLNRKQALVNAELNGQFKPGHPTVPYELFSEDIW